MCFNMLLCKFGGCSYNERGMWCLRPMPALNQMGICNYMYDKNGQQRFQAFQPVNDRLNLNIVEGEWKDVGTEQDAAIDKTTDDGLIKDAAISTGMVESREEQIDVVRGEESSNNDNAE